MICTCGHFDYLHKLVVYSKRAPWCAMYRTCGCSGFNVKDPAASDGRISR